VMNVHQVAQQMDSIAVAEAGAQLDARDDLDAEAIAGRLRLGNTRHGVMVGQSEDMDTTCSGLLHQHRW
jgi:hypothetical protein